MFPGDVGVRLHPLAGAVVAHCCLVLHYPQHNLVGKEHLQDNGLSEDTLRAETKSKAWWKDRSHHFGEGRKTIEGGLKLPDTCWFTIPSVIATYFCCNTFLKINGDLTQVLC